MKNLCIALGVGLSFSVMADETVVTKEAFVADIYGGLHRIERQVIAHDDGSYTILPGQRSPELVEIHRQTCNSYGARDVTGESFITLSKGAIDGVVCELEPDTKIKPSESEGQERLARPNGEIGVMAGPVLNVYAPNQVVPVNQNFSVTGSWDYVNSTDNAGPYSAHLWAGDCGIADSGHISAYSRGSRLMSVTCVAQFAGNWVKYIHVSIPNLTVQGTGTITAVQ
jgi:hypothetical protein